MGRVIQMGYVVEDKAFSVGLSGYLGFISFREA
jgi:hypothetical protein